MKQENNGVNKVKKKLEFLFDEQLQFMVDFWNAHKFLADTAKTIKKEEGSDPDETNK